ncbi:MAG: hypothetical protein WA208_19875 [Thermoanaerobaculia bacterium]
MRRLVASFSQETLVRLPGPPAHHTAASRKLVSYGASAIPYLLEGVGSPDPNVRRHSAFVLAQIGDTSAYHELQRAALREFAALEGATGADPRSRRMPLDMIVIALTRIDPEATMDWLCTQNTVDIRELYGVLSAILQDVPVCGDDEAALCRKRLNSWCAADRAVRLRMLKPHPWLSD